MYTAKHKRTDQRSKLLMSDAEWRDYTERINEDRFVTAAIEIVKAIHVSRYPLPASVEKRLSALRRAASRRSRIPALADAVCNG